MAQWDQKAKFKECNWTILIRFPVSVFLPLVGCYSNNYDSKRHTGLTAQLVVHCTGIAEVTGSDSPRACHSLSWSSQDLKTDYAFIVQYSDLIAANE